MGITEVELVKEMIARYKLLIGGLVIGIPIVMVIIGITAPIVLWLKCRDLREFVIFMSWAPYYGILAYITFASTNTALMYFYICIYYLTIRARLFNEKVDRILKGPFLVRKFATKLEMKSIVRDHARICMSVYDCNAFFGNLYSIGLIVCLPLNLIGLNLVLFTSMNLFTISLYLLVSCFAWILIFFGSFSLANVQHEIKKIYKKLCKLEWKFNNTPLEFKIKVSIIHIHLNIILHN
jgi:hypothetical protein